MTTPSPSSRLAFAKALAIRYGLALLLGIPAAVLAGAVGGMVVHTSLMAFHDEMTLASLPGMVVMGMLLGSLQAAPVTLGALPVAAVLLRCVRRFRWPIWLLVGAAAGACRILASPHELYGGNVPSATDLTFLAAGIAGGLAAAALFALVFPPPAPAPEDARGKEDES